MAPRIQCYITPVILATLVLPSIHFSGTQVPPKIYFEYQNRKVFFDSLTVNVVANYIRTKFQDAFSPASILPAYLLFMYIGTIIIPATTHHGATLGDGTKPVWKLNGFPLFLLAVAAYAGAGYYGILPAALLYDNYSSLFIHANLISFMLSFYLFVKGRAAGHSSGSVTEDFIMGTELTPYIGSVPVKLFWLKPSMTLWILLNVGFLSKHIQLLGHVSTPMLLYQAFTFIYVFDYFIFESYMTSTWDILHEHFGLMLVWGDFTFIPFAFSVQGWFLVNNNSQFSPALTAAIVSVFVIGFFIFRTCNMQKHVFKHDPKAFIWGKPPQVIETPKGKLLVSGWWGQARHINYLGDIILGISYCLPCLFSSILPYLYPTYLTLLLVHREVRDEKQMGRKYGVHFDEYKRRVPYRILPWIY